jgi:peptidoglycan-associated lipoprotein
MAAMATAVLGAGACTSASTAKPESRLGMQPGDENHRWNGNARRQGYGSKDIGAPGQGGGLSGAAGSNVGTGDTILFLSDSTDLTPESKTILDGFVAQMRQRPVRALSIEGHADERGTREYNLALGARRAANVKAYLVSKGMLESQVRTVSFGKERPVATCDDISCWAKNRRAQIVVAGR